LLGTTSSADARERSVLRSKQLEDLGSTLDARVCTHGLLHVIDAVSLEIPDVEERLVQGFFVDVPRLLRATLSQQSHTKIETDGRKVGIDLYGGAACLGRSRPVALDVMPPPDRPECTRFVLT